MDSNNFKINDKKHFTSWAPHYDRGFGGIFFRASYRAALKALKPAPHARTLEIGCGTGGFISAILHAEPNILVTGIDYTPAMLAEAELKFPKDARVRFICASADDLHLHELFDYIYCLDAFHHFTDVERVLAEMRRVLKHGGKILILDPIFDGWKSIFMKCVLPFLGEAHIFKRSTNELEQLFLKAHFRVVKTAKWLVFFKIFILETL